MKQLNPRENNKKQPWDVPLIICVLVLIFFGLVMIYDASVVAAYRDFGDKLYYFKNQLVFASLGIIAALMLSFFDYHKIIKYAPVFLAGAIGLLILVLIPHIGTKVYGARRWISLGGFTFQPSEFAKLSLIFYQTYVMSKFEQLKVSKVFEPARLTDVFYVLLLPIFILTALVVLEPDLGTALIFMGVSLAMYFIGGGALWHFALMIPPIIAAVVFAIIAQPYRIERLKAFIDPNYDPQGASYQINQILIALGNGGLLGVGIGGSRGKFDFIPEVHSDAIFAVIAEELGFVGAVAFMAVMIFLIFRAVQIARLAKDYEGKLLASGIAALFSLQAFLNIASNVALVPLTGIPLPFISAGGSSMLVTMVAIGVLLNINRQSKTGFKAAPNSRFDADDDK